MLTEKTKYQIFRKNERLQAERFGFDLADIKDVIEQVERLKEENALSIQRKKDKDKESTPDSP